VDEFLCAEQTQLALALHPDKNGAPNADEAFKSRFDPTISHQEEMKLTLMFSGFQGVSDIIRQVHCQCRVFCFSGTNISPL
jgi:hypothetical protein